MRYHVLAYLAGRQFEELSVDVGFGSPPPLDADILRGPDLLSFADIPPPEVPALPLESHVAEKIHAYTQVYAGGRASTRVKDLVDLVLIPSWFPFEASRLRRALDATFADGAIQPLPSKLPPPPSTWRPSYRRMASDAGLNPELAAGYEQARMFLDPVLGGIVPDAARWNPAGWMW